ncbi:hypothetical protein NP493_832g00013 [Ridgeia piscesae]|uniref:RRM domain-containing protein n=1 Tax=Ridgeia piscesae TaxID=27915 RepID=A0AAD9KMI7_RIDPI|nr:hypothetical protein NP493_832g00013 [Ridgeia piscesae]
MPPASPSTSQSGSHSGEQLSKTNLYIRGLKPNTTDKDLVNLCQGYGKIISTKAIIDQNTSQCKGYGFVDFESTDAAEMAVKALQARGIQAQMAKQQEQDPTNLYIANLPNYIQEADLKRMCSDFGQVISTRILTDNSGFSRGVGFVRMESKEKCEQIIQAFHGQCIPGWTGWQEPLTVKFADGGNKKKNQYHNRQWIDRSAEGISLAHYDQSGVAQNGLNPTVITPPIPRYTMATTPVTNYQLQSASWLHHPGQYIMQTPMPPVMQSSMHPSAASMDPNAVQLAAQMGQLQLSGTSYVTGPHGTYSQLAYPQSQGTPIMQTVVDVSSRDPNVAVTPGEEQHHYQQTYGQTSSK